MDDNLGILYVDHPLSMSKVHCLLSLLSIVVLSLQSLSLALPKIKRGRPRKNENLHIPVSEPEQTYERRAVVLPQEGYGIFTSPETGDDYIQVGRSVRDARDNTILPSSLYRAREKKKIKNAAKTRAAAAIGGGGAAATRGAPAATRGAPAATRGAPTAAATRAAATCGARAAATCGAPAAATRGAPAATHGAHATTRGAATRGSAASRGDAAPASPGTTAARGGPQTRGGVGGAASRGGAKRVPATCEDILALQPRVLSLSELTDMVGNQVFLSQP